MAKITEIKKFSVKHQKRVAAYARVSMLTDSLQRSISAQISYYSNLIQANPEWEYAGVYADKFISGTSTKGREGFQQLIKDCEEGKIDIVLTKSISRFARNTVDLLSAVRHLRDLGVEVRFEKERINSLSGDGEFMLTILASFAQEESRSTSENLKWSIQKRYQRGIPHTHYGIYGYSWEGDELVPIPEQAEIVKLIYANYLKGFSIAEIERQLDEMGVKSYKGGTFSESTIKRILSNSVYTGNLILQKQFNVDPIDKKIKINEGELTQYLVEDSHEAIITKETFENVQQEIKRRKELGVFANKSIKTSCFTSKIKCPVCGRSYTHAKMEKQYEVWICKPSRNGGRKCPIGGLLNQNSLKKALAEVLGTIEFDEVLFLKEIDFINIPERRMLEIHFKDGRIVNKRIFIIRQKDRWTPEMRTALSEKVKSNPRKTNGVNCFTAKIKCMNCGENFRGQQINHFKYWKCKANKCFKGNRLREDVLRMMLADILETPDFDEDIFNDKIDRIEMYLPATMVFCFKDGHKVVREWIKLPRKNTVWTREEWRKFN